MNTRYLKFLIASLVVVIVAFAYASTQLTINNTGTVILANKNLQGITFSPPTTEPNCNTATTYDDGHGTGALSSLNWGNIAQGSSKTAYICVMNADGAGQTYTVSTVSISPAAGIAVSYNGTSVLTSLPIPNDGTSLIIVSVSVSSSVSTGPFSFTTTIA